MDDIITDQQTTNKTSEKKKDILFISVIFNCKKGAKRNRK